MSKYCTCAGNFAYTVPIDDFFDKLKTFRNVARYLENNTSALYTQNGFDKPINAVWDPCQLCYATEDSNSTNQWVEFCLHLQSRVWYVKKKYYIYVEWGNLTNCGERPVMD